MRLSTRGHALIVGVGEYQNPHWNAPITINDARGVADALTDPTVGCYPLDQVTLLYDEQASRQGVRNALRQLAQATQPSDTVIVFLCGHGAFGDDGEYYFATQDTCFTPSNKIQAGTGLSGAEFIALLRTIKAQKLLIIVNACFSGSISPTLGASDSLGNPLPSTLSIEALSTGEGRAIITASRPSQYSYYHRTDSYTFFGQALINGLHGRGMESRNGYIGLYELYQHIYSNVTAAASAVNGIQEPVLTLLQGVGPFPVAYYPGCAHTDTDPADLQQTPPQNMAVEMVEQANGLTARHRRRASSSQTRDYQASNRLIDFGVGNTMGDITIGNIAGHNLVKRTSRE
jgi:hypothetical protein